MGEQQTHELHIYAVSSLTLRMSLEASNFPPMFCHEVPACDGVINAEVLRKICHGTSCNSRVI